MTPNANMVTRDNAPPENILNIPRIVFSWLWKNLAISAVLIPGTGMYEPNLKITIPNRTKRRRDLSSERPPPLFIDVPLFAIFPLLYFTASSFNCSLCTFSTMKTIDRDCFCKVTLSNDSRLFDIFTNQACLLQDI